MEIFLYVQWVSWFERLDEWVDVWVVYFSALHGLPAFLVTRWETLSVYWALHTLLLPFLMTSMPKLHLRSLATQIDLLDELPGLGIQNTRRYVGFRNRYSNMCQRIILWVGTSILGSTTAICSRRSPPECFSRLKEFFNFLKKFGVTNFLFLCESTFSADLLRFVKNRKINLSRWKFV